MHALSNYPPYNSYLGSLTALSNCGENGSPTSWAAGRCVKMFFWLGSLGCRL